MHNLHIINIAKSYALIWHSMLGNIAIHIKVAGYNIYIWCFYMHILLIGKNVHVCPLVKKSVTRSLPSPRV